jgi:hypothetical protein
VDSTSYVAVNLNVGVKVEVDVNHNACDHGRKGRVDVEGIDDPKAQLATTRRASESIAAGRCAFLASSGSRPVRGPVGV